MLWKFLARLCLALLSLRYSIEVRGLKEILQRPLKRKGGILFLPNHTAHMDPLFLFLLLWPHYRMRPLAVEYIYRLKILKPLMRLVRALAVPDFDSSVNSLKIRRGELVMQEIVKGLEQGDHFLLYPSGKLKMSGKEVIGGASGAHDLLQKAANANVVLIRTTGLWGSSFSRAIEGKTPSLPKVIWKGVKTLLRNGIFFAPRRKILIEMASEPADFSKSVSRVEFNRYLEQWYNQYPDEKGIRVPVEKPTLVSYSCFSSDFLPLFEWKKTKAASKGGAVSKEVRQAVEVEIKRILNRSDLQIEPQQSLALDLGMDSLNIAEMIAFLAARYDVEGVRPEEIETVSDVFEVAAGIRPPALQAKVVSTYHWPEETDRPDPLLLDGQTIPEVFLRSCHRMGSFGAAGDDLSGVQTYKKLKKAALVLAQSFQRLEGKYVGVLLPASTASYLTILALQLAGKVPVMLNWTLGPRSLEEMVRASGLTKVISSWRFLDRLAYVDLGKVVDQLLLLEDVRAGLTLKMKLWGVWLSLQRAPFKRKGVTKDSHAVVLFTSGTEANPKGVPLTHENILSNLRSALQCLNFQKTDVMYGILPPFHSFGFTVAGLAALLSGLKIAFYPDPTDSFALAEGIERWKVTIFCSAPSFLKGLFSAAKPSQLKSVKMFVSGAEKAPAELDEKIKALKTEAKLIQGYGITECSPMLAFTRPNLPPVGVGMPIPGIELVTIHPETLQKLERGMDGEICVRGPNVFRGYLEKGAKDPFIQLDGRSWYRTGDLGHLDPEGNLILSGRLKRFIKLGGEMISLGAVEEIFAQGKDHPSIAVFADERVEGKPQLVLFSTTPLDLGEANERLKKAGSSRLVKISSVIQVEEIPLLGTGKTDYRSLQKKLPPLGSQ
ncbi:MAG TPA: AMP-binding protein [Chlamydiales bacterium]|jgi:long-chain-fatty-acid--[acyl-carrier-protein] ligase